MKKSLMNKKFWKLGAIVGAGVLASQAAWAQPDPNDAPKGANPPENTRAPRGQGNRGNAAETRKRMEDNMRAMMMQAGVADVAQQDAILAFVKADMDARRPLREQGNKLFQALRNDAVTQDQLLALVTDYRAAQEAEKVRREKAIADLDAEVQFSKNPRLEAMLLLGGLIGDNSTPMMGGLGAQGGRGGQGGPNGRNGNNAGNQGANVQGGALNEARQKVIARFDKDGNGKLEGDEQTAFNAWRDERRKTRQNRQQNGAQPAPPADGAMPGA